MGILVTCVIKSSLIAVSKSLCFSFTVALKHLNKTCLPLKGNSVCVHIVCVSERVNKCVVVMFTIASE